MIKAAIDFSDAVIQGSPEINAELTEYIVETKKPSLAYHPMETYLDAFSSFYDEVLAPK